LSSKETPTPTEPTINNQSESNITSTGSRKRSSLSLGSSKSRDQIKKKKLEFAEKSNSVEKQESSEFSLGASDSDLELSSIELPEEAKPVCVVPEDIKKEDVEKLKLEVEDLKKQLEIFDKRKKEIETLNGLIVLWRKSGIEAIDLLITKTDPPQSVDAVLKCFNIPREIFFESESEPD
jgi:hypothetical protein